MVNNSPAKAGDIRDMSVPGWGRAPGRGHGKPLQYFCLENPWMEEPGRLQSMGVTKSRTRLSDFTGIRRGGTGQFVRYSFFW